MKTVLIAIERSSFTYLYKFGYCQVSKGQMLEYSASEAFDLARSNNPNFVNKLESRLPHFEQEHEVLVLEVNQVIAPTLSMIELNFEQVLQIIPLNNLAKELIQVKLSENLFVSDGFPDAFYKKLTEIRQHKIRGYSASTLVKAFNLQPPETGFRKQVQQATLIQLRGRTLGVEDSTLAHVLDFNITPSFIPEGNIEGLIKLICIGSKKLGSDINLVQKGIVYKVLVDHIKAINQESDFISAFNRMNTLFKSVSEEIQEKFERLKSTLAEENTKIDSLLVIYLYFSFRKRLQKGEFNLYLLKPEIDNSSAPAETAAALYLIGYTLSMSVLFQSLHRLRNAPVFSLKQKTLSKVQSQYDTSSTASSAQEPFATYGNQPAKVNNPKPTGKEKKPQQSNLFETDTVKIHPNQKIIKRINVMVKGANSKLVKEIVTEMLSGHSTPNIQEFQDRFLSTENLVKKNGELLKPVLHALQILQEELDDQEG